MSERSEPKQVCRRSALAFLGCAAVFGLVASSALLTVTEAEAQATTTPAAPTTPPADTAKSGTERRQERRTRASRTATGTTHGTRRAASGAAHRTRRATGRARRHHPPPPSKKSNRSVRANNGNRPASARARGRPYSAPSAPGYRTTGPPARARHRALMRSGRGLGP